jgi:hypothetical protein
MHRGETPVNLTAQEIGYLKELCAAGERGRTVSAPTPRNELHRLIDAGYVNDHAISMDAVNYTITKRGRRVLAAAKQ